MAVTVTSDFVVLDTFDSSADQTADSSIFSTTGGVNFDIKVQGSAANEYQASSQGVGAAGKYNSANNWDISDTHVFAWFSNLDIVETKANGGYRIRAADAGFGNNNNWGDWIVGGQDTIGAKVNGFFILAIDTTRPFDFTQGTPPSTSSTDGLGVGAHQQTASGSATTFVDEIKKGSKIIVKGGTSTDRGHSAQVASDDKTNGRGAFKDILGLYYIISGITFGDSGSSDSFYADNSETWLFEDQNVANDLYTLEFVGNSTSTNQVKFGIKIGSGLSATGLAGNTFIANGPPFRITAIDSNVQTNLYGCNFTNSSQAAGPVRLEHSNVECLSCLFSRCGTISVRNGAVLRGATITDTTAPTTSAALDLGSSNPVSDSVRDLRIQNSSKGILLQGSGDVSYDLRNITFLNNTADIRVDFNSADTVTINILEGGSTPTIDNVNGSTVNVKNAVNVKVTTVDVDGNAIPDVRVYLEADSGGPLAQGTQIFKGLTDSNGIIQVSFDFSGDQPVTGNARKASSSPFYKPANILGTITSSGLDNIVQMILDE